MSSGGPVENFINIDGKGRIGLSPKVAQTAKVHLPAGEAGAGLAPLKFSSGTNLSSPEAGVAEYDGLNFYLTRTSTRRKIPLSNDTTTSSTTVTNTITETTLMTAVVPANGIAAADVIRINAAGFYSTANGTDTFTLRFKVGSTTLISVTSDAANVTNAPFHGELVTVFRTVGVSGTTIAHGSVSANNVGKDTSNTATTTVDTTATMTFTVTIQWSNALAGNTFTQTIGFSEVL